MDNQTNPVRDSAASEEETTRSPSVRTEASGDGEKLEGLTQLRDLYVEAQGLALRGQPHENLDWILGPRRDLSENPLPFQTKRIELISLWLEDLVAELEIPPPVPETTGSESRSASAHQSRREAAQRLREATQAFLKLYRPSKA